LLIPSGKLAATRSAGVVFDGTLEGIEVAAGLAKDVSTCASRVELDFDLLQVG